MGVPHEFVPTAGYHEVPGAMPARSVWMIAVVVALHPVWSGERATARVGHAGPRAGIAKPIRLRGGLACVPASPPSSQGLAAAQVVELADSLQEAAAALATCAPADMASFATPSAVNRALAAMRAVPAATRASILPALIRNGLARVGTWTKGSSIARTLRLLSELHLSAHDGRATSVDRRGEDQAPPAPPATPVEPVVALAHALVSQGVLDASILASFSAASVADALASLVALGFQSNGQVGHAAGELPAISADVLASLTAQAAQAGVASVKEGCDLLWAAARALLLQACRLALSHLKGGGGATDTRDSMHDSQALVQLLLLASSLLDRSCVAPAHASSGIPSAVASADGAYSLRAGLCQVIATLCAHLCEHLGQERFATGKFGRHPARDPACGEWLHRAQQALPIVHAVSQGRRALMRAAAGEGGEGGADLELALEASTRAAVCLFRRLTPASFDVHIAPTASAYSDAVCHVTSDLLDAVCRVTSDLLAWADVRIGYYLWAPMRRVLMLPSVVRRLRPAQLLTALDAATLLLPAAEGSCLDGELDLDRHDQGEGEAEGTEQDLLCAFLAAVQGRLMGAFNGDGGGEGGGRGGDRDVPCLACDASGSLYSPQWNVTVSLYSPQRNVTVS